MKTPCGASHPRPKAPLTTAYGHCRTAELPQPCPGRLLLPPHGHLLPPPPQVQIRARVLTSWALWAPPGAAASRFTGPGVVPVDALDRDGEAITHYQAVQAQQLEAPQVRDPPVADSHVPGHSVLISRASHTDLKAEGDLKARWQPGGFHLKAQLQYPPSVSCACCVKRQQNAAQEPPVLDDVPVGPLEGAFG